MQWKIPLNLTFSIFSFELNEISFKKMLAENLNRKINEVYFLLFPTSENFNMELNWIRYLEAVKRGIFWHMAFREP